MKAEKAKKEKPVPVRCVCGRAGVIVKCKSKKMVSCADPLNCVGNYRTAWNSSESAAIIEWNNLISSDRG